MTTTDQSSEFIKNLSVDCNFSCINEENTSINYTSIVKYLDRCIMVAPVCFNIVPCYKKCLVSVSTTCNCVMRSLNKKYRAIDKTTNVLSFSYHTLVANNNFFLGDIIISYEKIIKESNGQNKSIHDHFYHMVVHGFLHLLGYDHQNEQELKCMKALEQKILLEVKTADLYNIF